MGFAKSRGGFVLSIDALSLRSGERMGIVGRNGAGKSTLFDLILNECGRDAGSITLFGRDNRNDEVEIKQNLGFVIDKAGFDERFSLREAGRIFSCLYRDWDGEYYLGLLEQFELSERARFKELSRGMSVKAQLALALAHRPRLLVLDEVTSGIDPVSRARLVGTIKRYLDEDASRGLLFSTHITDDLRLLSSSVLILERGSVVSLAPIESYTDVSIDDVMMRYADAWQEGEA